MDRPAHKMFLVIDENVTDDAATFLRERGHRIELIRDWLGQGTKDRVVAFAANYEAKQSSETATIVTHDKDFKSIAVRAGNKQGLSLSRVGRISLTCRESRACARLRQVMDLIEYEFTRAQQRGDKRIIISISDTTVLITR